MRFEDVLNNGRLWAAVYDGEAENALTKVIRGWMNPMYLNLFFSKHAANLDELFRPLENSRIREMVLSREKAKGKRVSGHPSWLRIYAIKLAPSIYLITGGAIKLTPTMAEREHTLLELRRMELVRNYLIDNGVYDADGIKDLIS